MVTSGIEKNFDTRTNRSKLITDTLSLKMEREHQKVQEVLEETPHES